MRASADGLPGGSSTTTTTLEAAGEKVEALSRDEAFDLLCAEQKKPQDALLAFGSIYAMGPLRDRLEEETR